MTARGDSPASLDRPVALRSWDPWEPGLALTGLLLLLATALLPWWGFQSDQSIPGFTSSSGVDFGLLMVEEWNFRFGPQGVFRRGNAQFWWAFVAEHPDYAGYAVLASTLLVIWVMTLGIGLVAVIRRARPGSRRGGRPTLFTAMATGVTAMAIVTAFVGFPEALGFPSFVGSGMDLTWGPKIGWFLAWAVSILLGLATWLGRRLDRLLDGVCWACFRDPVGDVCTHCEAPQ